VHIALKTDDRTRGALANPSREWFLFAFIIIAYSIIRLLLIPTDADLTKAFSHDSGYLALVADNIAKGRGYVHDALWLVFLLPPALPMPYHNANPLFPTLAAGITALTGDVFRSGFVVSALASVILLCAGIALFRPMVRRGWQAVALATAVVLFPPVLVDSFLYLTDALCASLILGFVAVVSRTRAPAAVFLGGMLIGLAWLTRGATVLAGPALLVYFFLRFERRAAVTRLALLLLGALLVAAPWLIHTKHVWGSYFRSDSGYAIIQDLAAHKWHQDSVVRFWHSTEQPPPLSAFVLESPAGFARHVTLGALQIVKRTTGSWSMHNLPVALVLLGGAAFLIVERRRWWSAEGAALTVFAVTTVAVLGIRANSFEERYVNTLTIFFVMLAVAGCWRAWQRSPGRARPVLAIALLAVWGVLIPRAVLHTYQQVYAPDLELVRYRAAAAEVDRRFAQGQPVVVGMVPYFYSLETRRPALNFPDAPDEFLIGYMDRYHARYLFLTGEELQFWRPSWSSLSALPNGLRLSGTVDGGFVFERTAQGSRLATISSH
jgi:4-amino-4-deoxy-L-arabinose transferase-like glycosyltransferase